MKWWMKNNIVKVDKHVTDRLVVRPLSRQSLAVFWVLSTERRHLTALQIALYLGTSPRNIGRLVKPLEKWKMVRSGKIPYIPNKTTYYALPIRHAEKMYLAHARTEFWKLFDEAYRIENRVDSDDFNEDTMHTWL